MIGKKIGSLVDIFKEDSELNKYILLGLFEKIHLHGDIQNIQDSLRIKIDKNVNKITLKTLDDRRLSITFQAKGGETKGRDGKPIEFMRTIHTFVIDYFKDGFPVYNSEY